MILSIIWWRIAVAKLFKSWWPRGLALLTTIKLAVD